MIVYAPLILCHSLFEVVIEHVSVCMENVEGAAMATRHLIAQGCRHIVHISGPQDFPVSKERIDGYTQAMRSASLEPRVVHGDFLPNSGYACLKSLIDNSMPFDGVFCGNDMMAIGALKAMKDVGIRCPEEVRLIGYDNSFVASLIQPSLSSILVPQQGLGRKATLLLHERINGTLDSPAVTAQLPIRLVVRRSSDPQKFDDWSLSIL